MALAAGCTRMEPRRWRAVASARVRAEPEAFTVAIAGKPETSSTTIHGLGGHVLVIATTLPDRALGLTSCYLGQLGGAIAASHLHRGPGRDERLTQHVIPAGRPHATTAGACLLDHAAELQHQLANHTAETITVDVADTLLERAAEAWGPAAPGALEHDS
jgi:hypothetical protein